jgi:hypothetical protein
VNAHVPEIATDLAAACAATNTLWLGSLNGDAQVILTVLGIVWLSLQIAFKVLDRINRKNP